MKESITNREARRSGLGGIGSGALLVPKGLGGTLSVRGEGSRARGLGSLASVVGRACLCLTAGEELRLVRGAGWCSQMDSSHSAQFSGSREMKSTAVDDFVGMTIPGFPGPAVL